MKNPRTPLCVSLLCGGLLAVTAGAQTMIQDFDYANDADLLAAWSPASATLSLSDYVAATATGSKSLRVDRSFPAAPWDAEIITGPVLTTPVFIASTQYVTLRVAGDPQFTNASYQTLFVYAYDGAGNFGRWGAPVPTATEWKVFNFLASGIEQPWNSPALPDLGNIVRFDFVLYGQGDPPGTAFSATVYVDELMIRETALVEVPPSTGPKMIEDFEYASDTDLLAAWAPSSSILTLSSYVAAGSTGTNSLRVDRYFPAATWDTEVIRGTELPAPMSIAPNQYVTLRVAGDPQFTNATYQTLFLYAYDAANNFGRWGSPVPTVTNWQVFNFLASSIGKPWDSPALPDLNNIVKFSFYLYGQGDPPGAEYPATIYVDDVMVRDTALIEFPAPSPMRTLLDDFESYADDAALWPGFYTTVPSGATATPSLETPAPQGNRALKLSIDFTSIQYPWAAVRSPSMPKFSFPKNAVVQLKFKGDPAMAAVADAGTSFWMEFFDEGGRRLSNNQVSGAAVANGDWTTVRLPYGSFWSSTPVDTGNLVQWRILVQAWTGDPASLPAPMTGIFYVDDIQITVPPEVDVVREGSALKLQLSSLIAGKTYTVLQTTDFASWSTATTIMATSSTGTWTIPAGQKGFYQVSYAP